MRTVPPVSKVNKEQILQAVLDITRREGFEKVNARSIGYRLGCSARPIFTWYEGMEEVKRDFWQVAFTYYRNYARHFAEASGDYGLGMGLATIRFAREETHLYRYLFMSETLHIRRQQDFFRDPENVRTAERIAQKAGIGQEEGMELHFKLFIYTHGIATLVATGDIELEEPELERLLREGGNAFVEQAVRTSKIRRGNKK